MKKIVLLGAALLLATAAYAGKYEDGIYRGFFPEEVCVEFELKNDVVTSAKYRTLNYKKTDYLKEESVKALKEQYDALLTFATGKNVDEAMNAMYAPGKIEKAGATIRSAKVRFAMKDGLVHAPYSLPKTK